MMLKRIIDRKRNKLAKRFNRVLPINELFSDRWEKARSLNFGDKSSIYDSSIVFGEPIVGENVWIGPYTLLDAASSTIEIGNFVSIGTGSSLFTHDTSMYYATNGVLPKKIGNIKIGNNCSIGSQSIIGPGVTIGNNSIIAANSFVNKNVPAYTIVAGTPAKAIGQIIEKGNEYKVKYFKK